MRLVSTVFTVFFLIFLNTSSAQDLEVSHSYFVEIAEFETALTPALRHATVKKAVQFSGFYQGMFELKGIKEFPRVNCSAVRTYSAEFSIIQDGQNLTLRTPSGISLTGRVKGQRRFRTTAIVTDGQLTRNILIRGKLKANNEARIANVERISVGDIKACRFVHKARMQRFFK